MKSYIQFQSEKILKSYNVDLEKARASTPIGTKVTRKNGVVEKKTEDGWVRVRKKDHPKEEMGADKKLSNQEEVDKKEKTVEKEKTKDSKIDLKKEAELIQEELEVNNTHISSTNTDLNYYAGVVEFKGKQELVVSVYAESKRGRPIDLMKVAFRRGLPRPPKGYKYSGEIFTDKNNGFVNSFEEYVKYEQTEGDYESFEYQSSEYGATIRLKLNKK